MWSEDGPEFEISRHTTRQDCFLNTFPHEVPIPVFAAENQCFCCVARFGFSRPSFKKAASRVLMLCFVGFVAVAGSEATGQ